MPYRTASPTKQAVAVVLFTFTTMAAPQNAPPSKALDTSAVAQLQEFRYSVGPGATIGVSNPFGAVTLRPHSGNEVVIQASPAGGQVEVHHSQTGNRIEVRSRPAPRTSHGEASVNYTIQVPTEATVTVRSNMGSILAEGLRGDLTLESDAGTIEVRDYGASHLLARTVGSPIIVSDVSNGHVELSSVSGRILLIAVSASRVAVNTTGGNVEYDGGFRVEGEYTVTTHSGNIEVAFPSKASLEITAQSVKGRVEDEFHFQPQGTPNIDFRQGNWFAGTANTGNERAGAASIRLRSFSGTIRVTRQ